MPIQQKMCNVYDFFAIFKIIRSFFLVIFRFSNIWLGFFESCSIDITLEIFTPPEIS